MNSIKAHPKCRFALLTIVALPLLLVGCGQKTASGPSPADKQAFDKAPPQLKQVWDQALEADQTNGYVLEQRLLYGLLKQPLAPEQQAAVSNQIAGVGKRLYDAADKGNTAALEALRELRRNAPNR